MQDRDPADPSPPCTVDTTLGDLLPQPFADISEPIAIDDYFRVD